MIFALKKIRFGTGAIVYQKTKQGKLPSAVNGQNTKWASKMAPKHHEKFLTVLFCVFTSFALIFNISTALKIILCLKTLY